MNDDNSDDLSFKIERNVIQTKELIEYRNKVESIQGLKGWLKYARRYKFQCNSKNVYRRFVKFFPFVDWIQTYKWKEDVKYDIIAGFTVGIILIPQGLAYARLSTLPPVIGLYMSFIIPLLYMLSGSSKSMSFGSYSIVSLLVGSLLSSDVPQQYANTHKVKDSQSVLVPMDLLTAKLIVSASLVFYTGVLQIILSLFKVGFITNFLSSTTTKGFIFGSAIQIVTTQISYLLGLSVPGSYTAGISPAIKTYIYILSHLPSANVAEIVITILGITFLILCRYLNAYTEPKINFPIPSELILIIISTGISYGIRLDKLYKVRILGVIPSGLPKVVVPDFTIFTDVISSAVMLALVSYAVTVSLAKGLASKRGDKISYNGELFSYGFCNTVASFFQCYVSGGSLSRSAVLNKLGRTQLSAIVSSIVLIVVLLAAATLFYYLPLTILSCIILVAFIGVFKDGAELKLIYHLSKFQAFLWIITALSVVCLDVQYGLLVGVALNLLFVIYKILIPKLSVLGELDDKKLYLDKKIYNTNEVSSDISIIQFNTSLLYLNFQRFSKGLNVVVDKMHANLKMSRLWGVVIIDGKYMTGSDIDGGQVLREIIVSTKKKNIKIYLANTSDTFLEFIEKYLKHFKCSIQSFATVTDAIIYAKNEIRHLNESGNLDPNLNHAIEILPEPSEKEISILQNTGENNTLSQVIETDNKNEQNP